MKSGRPRTAWDLCPTPACPSLQACVMQPCIPSLVENADVALDMVHRIIVRKQAPVQAKE